MKLAAIDIGSNAIRLQVSKVLEDGEQPVLKRIEYIRFPLRLGHDVFSLGKISDKNEYKFMQLMRAFQLLIELYEVDQYMACATSAMREAENAQTIVKKVKQFIGLKINVISGKEEAEIINLVIKNHLDENTYLHIDVGGGSTEFNLYEDKLKVATQSFKVGTVRRIEHHESPHILKKMRQWVETQIKSRSAEKIIAIGTGGNINKLYDISGRSGMSISIKKLEELKNYLDGYTLDERIKLLKLNPDRADVIVPASEIYLSAMRWSGAKKILVPDAGLKDGIMQLLYQREKGKKTTQL